jgi:hypothetical protein
LTVERARGSAHRECECAGDATRPAQRERASTVPAILPFRSAWVIFTGVAHIAAGVALLADRLARLAATMEAGMIGAFGLFVRAKPVLAAPGDVKPWIPFVVTVAVASGVWAVASRMSGGWVRAT